MEITISTSYDLSGLAADWMELESRADGGFFLSWRWMGSWLKASGAQPLLVKAQKDGKTVALGLLNPVRRRRHFLSVSQLCLHETGRSECDAVMIEHNNFLMERSAPPGVMTEILRALQAVKLNWDEIVLGGVSSSLLARVEAAGLTVEIDRLSPNFTVDLSQAWEETLSANQRAQLRQSRSFAERAGPLRLEAAADPAQALDFFEKMVGLHTVYWQQRGKPGAFATAFSRAFHRELITSSTGPAGVELLALTAGSESLGYLYNFHSAGRVYNYQSGFSYHQDNRHRPGLIAHAMAIARAQANGSKVYDFLAGDARYKARLGHMTGTLVWCRGQKDRPLLAAERFARRLRRGLSPRRPPG
jgi:CelD/BcsL family acetyltransferase involved in cellulose biosynthesis